MYWANFLHFYQPAGQQPDILEAIVQQSYKPLLLGIKKRPRVHLTLNINGALLELFDAHGHRKLIDILRNLGRAGRVEFTSSAKYHAMLPFLESDEVVRQISTNDETSKFFLGDAYAPKGFFPPEMAYTDDIGRIISELGFKWILLDEIARGGADGNVDYTKLYRVSGTKLNVFFRERRLSNLIMSAVVRSRESLLTAMREDLKTKRYVLTAMDGETFGHHRPGLAEMLMDVYDAPEFELIKISDIPKHYRGDIAVLPEKSTWASSAQDIAQGIQFLSWSDPENPIHKWQWEFTKTALEEVRAMSKNHPRFNHVRAKMDEALSSDQFFWASAKPWWSVEMIEIGAWRLLDVIRNVPDVSAEKLKKASWYYENIISTAFTWQRTGKVRHMMREQKSILRVPFKDRTIGRGGAERGVYHAFMTMMKNLEKKAARSREYEKAILWRDSAYKLSHKLDIYDTINAVDLLRVEMPHEEVEKTIEKYKGKYRAIRGGQPEQRGA